MDDMISIVIPVYNTPQDLLRRGLNAIIEYGTGYYEVILVDDGSTNDAGDICEEYSKKYECISVIHQDNSGVSVARNRGLELSKGKYIVFSDPDDFLHKEVFGFTEQLVEEQDIIIFDYIRELSSGEQKLIQFKANNIDYTELARNVLFDNNIYGEYYAGAIWAKAFNREFLLKNNLFFDPKLRKAQDRVFMLYAYNKANKIKYLPITTYTYYENMDSICNTYKPGSYIRSESFIEAVDKYIKNDYRMNNELKDRVLAKVYMNSFFEIVYLDFFNINNSQGLNKRIKLVENEYRKLNVHEKISKSSLRNYQTKIEKIKFILIKYRLWVLLDYFIHIRQNKRSNRG